MSAHKKKEEHPQNPREAQESAEGTHTTAESPSSRSSLYLLQSHFAVTSRDVLNTPIHLLGNLHVSGPFDSLNEQVISNFKRISSLEDALEQACLELREVTPRRRGSGEMYFSCRGA